MKDIIMSLVNKKENKEKRVAGSNGKIAAEETYFNKLVRLIGLSIIGEERYYPEKNSISNMLDIFEYSKNLEERDYDRYIELIEFTRLESGLRHSVLYSILGVIKAGKGNVIDKLTDRVLLRPSDVTDILNIYLSIDNNKKTLPGSLKRLITKALNRYDQYQYEKYGRKKDSLNMNLVDVFNLVHPKPKDKEYEVLFKKVIEQDLDSPETWEHILSNEVEETINKSDIILLDNISTNKKFKTKKEAWTYLIKTKKLPSLAALRNISNMLESNIDINLLKNYIDKNISTKRIFPLQILNAYVNTNNEEIKEVLIKKLSISKGELLKGKTLIVLDISGSMGEFNLIRTNNLASRAISMFLSIANNVEDFELVLTAGNDMKRKHASLKIKDKKIFKNLETLLSFINEQRDRNNLGYGGIFTKQCLDWIKENNKIFYERVIVISDSQDCDYSVTTNDLPILGKFNYINNIAAYKNVGYNESTNGFKEITTFSSKIIDFIKFNEEFREN
jgi:hypothetical protein